MLLNIISHGFSGRVYPINPRYEEILGYKAYRSLLDLPESPDIVVIAVGEYVAVEAVREAAEKGARLAVVLTSGGRELSEKLRAAARGSGLRIVGPNSAGIVLAHTGLYATIEYTAPPGRVAVISQSGALGGVAMHWLSMLSSGVSFFLSLGNMSDLGVCEALEYAAEDQDTDAVVAYIEWVRSGHRYRSSLEELKKTGKPVCVVKGGRGPRSSEAVQTHTGGLAGSYEVFSAATRQAGAHIVNDIVLATFLCEAKRRIKILGHRALVVTNSGGLGVVLASQLESQGYSLPTPSHYTLQRIHAIKKGISGINPIDLQGDATMDQLVEAASIASDDENADFIVLAYVPTRAETPEKICKKLARLGALAKPVIVVAEGYGSAGLTRCGSGTAIVIPSTLIFTQLLHHYS